MLPLRRRNTELPKLPPITVDYLLNGLKLVRVIYRLSPDLVEKCFHVEFLRYLEVEAWRRGNGWVFEAANPWGFEVGSYKPGNRSPHFIIAYEK
jgi:hypothetical protein